MDFGLTFVTNSANSIIPSTLPQFPVGTYRYMSPELLVPEDPSIRAMPSTKSDIYALAMVIIEVVAGYLFSDTLIHTRVHSFLLVKSHSMKCGTQ